MITGTGGACGGQVGVPEKGTLIAEIVDFVILLSTVSVA